MGQDRWSPLPDLNRGLAELQKCSHSCNISLAMQKMTWCKVGKDTLGTCFTSSHEGNHFHFHVLMSSVNSSTTRT